MAPPCQERVFRTASGAAERQTNVGEVVVSTSANPSGMHPVNWFPERDSAVRLARLPSSDGIAPLSWFPARDNV